MGLSLTELLVEYLRSPLGLDEKAPRFSWQLSSDKKDTLQTAVEIRVREAKTEEEVWDSGLLSTDVSTGITYEGKALKPCTAYVVQVEVTDNYGRKAVAETVFETGFLKKDKSVWEGADWIGAPDFHVAANARGVFVLGSTFRMKEGSKRAGVVFGANDFRLLDHNQNEYGLEGENYIRYEINRAGETPVLDIYRVGYAKDDKKDVPFATVELDKNVNFDEFHCLKIVVDGDKAFTYLDEKPVDVPETAMGPMKISGRVLNPRGHNDVLTYPRLNEIGFFAGEGDTAYFKDLTVKNLRTPGRTFVEETPEKVASIFAELPKEEGCFAVSGTQITKDPSRGAIPMLRSNIPVRKDAALQRARLYVTARGIYDVHVNGARITENLLAPGLTQYDRRMNYQAYDLTGILKPGNNGIGVALGSGWWCDAQTFVVKNYNYFGDKEALLAKIVLEFADGDREVYTTNPETWKYFGDGPYRYSGFFLGEQYDARKKAVYDAFSLADFDDSGWSAAAKEPWELPVIAENRTFPAGFGRSWPQVHGGEVSFEGGYPAPVHVTAVRSAKKRLDQGEKIYIYDLEQEMAGVPRIHFHEKAGTKVIIRYAEVLYPNLPEYGENVGKLMLENYRDATSTDIYICSGEEGEVYQPRFTFHGYRYIEISGVENPPALSEVESLQYSSIEKFAGSFESSHALLNRFTENVHWSQLCNFINIPTDCPQRNERMGWAGDTHVFCHTALLNSDLKPFYERYLQAFEDLQTGEGQYPEIAPVGGGFGGVTYECASIFIAYELYEQYGDARILEKYYPGMKKYMEYMKDKGLPGAGSPAVGPLGDWLAPEETDLPLLWNAFYYREAVLMEKIAGILKDEEGAKTYHELAEKCRRYWNGTFVDPETKKTRTLEGKPCDTQCSYVLGLQYGIMEDREAAAKHLLRKTRAANHTVGTGFFGTGLLNQALCDTGASEDAYKLMLQTAFPSWLYPVTQGATTIWEHWDSLTEEKGFGGQNAMNSFNHYSLGSVLSWLYQYVLGIRREEEHPGFSHFRLEPVIGDLTWAKGSVNSPCGVIESGWKKENGRILYQCEIPVNTRATLVLPGGKSEKLGSGRHEFTV